VQPLDLKPSDILIERFVAWKAIVKQLIAYFEVCIILLFIEMYVISRNRVSPILRIIQPKR
jgi:hypothetical protein